MPRDVGKGQRGAVSGVDTLRTVPNHRLDPPSHRPFLPIPRVTQPPAPRMTRVLPNEILASILEHCLVPSDALFTHTRRVSKSYHPRSQSPTLSARPSPKLVLVCRQWMYVGRRLLYRAVMLRTCEQVDRLAANLKADPWLAECIRKLRVDRGLGAKLKQILLATRSRLIELCLVLDIPSTDQPGSLEIVLQQMRPRRLTLVYDEGQHQNSTYTGTNKQSYMLASLLSNCIFSWNLVS